MKNDKMDPTCCETFTRLTEELRGLHRLLGAVRHELDKANIDLDRLSIPGGVKRLQLDRYEAVEENKELKKEVNRLKIYGPSK